MARTWCCGDWLCDHCFQNCRNSPGWQGFPYRLEGEWETCRRGPTGPVAGGFLCFKNRYKLQHWIFGFSRLSRNLSLHWSIFWSTYLFARTRFLVGGCSLRGQSGTVGLGLRWQERVRPHRRSLWAGTPLHLCQTGLPWIIKINGARRPFLKMHEGLKESSKLLVTTSWSSIYDLWMNLYPFRANQLAKRSKI